MAGATPVFADHRSRAPDARPGATEAADHVRGRRRSCRCISTDSRPTCRRSQAIARTTRIWRSSRTRVRRICATCAGGRSARSAPPARSASIRRRISARSATRGAVVTNDAALAEQLERLRNGGQTDRYHHVEFGVNSRLDEMQAAILRARLPLLPGWTARRRALAARYRRALAGGAGRRAAGMRSRSRLSPVPGARRRPRRAFRRIWPRAASARSCTTRSRFRASRRSRPDSPRRVPGRRSRLRGSLLAAAPSALSRRRRRRRRRGRAGASRRPAGR